MENLDVSDKLIINLADEILRNFKDGIYAYDDEAKAQSKSHYNHKTRIKKWLVCFFNNSIEIPNGKNICY